MIHFDTGEATRLPDCRVLVGGDFEDLDLVSVAKWGQETEYTKIQAYYLKFGEWK
jgi:hypothetical protein